MSKKLVITICLVFCFVVSAVILSGCTEAKVITWEKDADFMQSSIPQTNREGKATHLAGDEKEIVPNVGIKF